MWVMVAGGVVLISCDDTKKTCVFLSSCTEECQDGEESSQKKLLCRWESFVLLSFFVPPSTLLVVVNKS